MLPVGMRHGAPKKQQRASYSDRPELQAQTLFEPVLQGPKSHNDELVEKP